MPYRRMLADLFEEEDKAREMAHRLMHVANTSREGALGERAALVEFLDGLMERHMAYEEAKIFPKLEALGLTAEVGVARKQHESVRKAAAELRNPGPGTDVPRLVFETARLMLHHTNFEGDYIYPELSHDQWMDLMRATARGEA